MIKYDKNFAISKKLYSFKKGSLNYNHHSDEGSRGPYGRYTMDVFYYKKKDGLIAACFGEVWDYAERGLSEDQFIEQYRSSYGPNMIASFDGKHWNGDDNRWSMMVDYVGELNLLLQAYPEIPNRYRGWYVNS